MVLATTQKPDTRQREAIDEFRDDVLGGLAKPRKTLPCRYLYDARGSELFEAITNLPEYYPTRTERSILETNAEEIAALVPEGGVLVEFGSGSSVKTEILLAKLPRISAYVAIDVSSSALEGAQDRLRKRFPHLEIRTIHGDFSRSLVFPPDIAARHITGFFPGSTIGNQTPREALELLIALRKLVGPMGQLIVGVDVKKDVRTLIAAYDDAAGITAAFNLNLLARINRELGADFDLARFEHRALYDPREGRIEMHLKSIAAQNVTIWDECIHFAAGESIHTESSYKYTIEEFQKLARRAGWEPARVWIDPKAMFTVHGLA